MRLFAAIDLDAAVRRKVAEEQSALREALGGELRWVQPPQLHLTLLFFGAVDRDRVEGLVAGFGAPLAGEPFDLVLGGLGVFPAREAPRALWIGVRSGEAPLQTLHHQVARRAAGCGFDVGGAPYRPHLTLARWKRSRPGEGLGVAGQPAFRTPITQRVDHVTLYESQLSSGPPSYVERARANLNSI